MIDLFREDDFLVIPKEELTPLEAVTRANVKLKAYIQCLEKVYGDIRLGGYHGRPLLWSIDEKPDSTHSVRLIGLERLNRS